MTDRQEQNLCQSARLTFWQFPASVIVGLSYYQVSAIQHGAERQAESQCLLFDHSKK